MLKETLFMSVIAIAIYGPIAGESLLFVLFCISPALLLAVLWGIFCLASPSKAEVATTSTPSREAVEEILRRCAEEAHLQEIEITEERKKLLSELEDEEHWEGNALSEFVSNPQLFY